jgi:hypothetical protein
MLLTPNGRFELNTKVGSLDLFPPPDRLLLDLRSVSASQIVRVFLVHLASLQFE